MTLVLVGSLLSMMFTAVIAALIELARCTSAELVEAAAATVDETITTVLPQVGT
ncbi:hypothetical protein [Muricoccus aerilatus]|uniref:hypothetical protein n=1 Tax=Muricoccus aerilatus TaxID=452982 RepID=UPI0012EBE974|nr:hypothetical protein [Roseomonas aerilata]